jgi:exopolysaccharide production protein ExoQ
VRDLHSYPLSERIFAVVALSFFARVFLPVTSGFELGEYSVEGALTGNVWEQAFGAVIYITSGALLLKEQSPLRLAMANPVLTIFIALAVASIAWSAAPEPTLRRAVGLLGTAVFGMYLAYRFSPHQVLWMIGVAYSTAIAFSIILIIYVPSFGTYGTMIAGIYGHKNDLGRAMVVATLALWANLRNPVASGWKWVLGSLLLAAVLLFASRSAQAVVGFTFGFGVMMPLLTICSRWSSKITMRLAVFLITVTLLLALLWSITEEAALGLLGRDDTLTDRTLIWDLLEKFGQERPLLGYGYGGFWESDVAAWFDNRWAALDHAHNGYMDVWLALGYVGLATFVLLLLSAGWRTWNAYLARPVSQLGFFPVFVAVAALLNLVGHVFPLHNSIYWMLLCYCAVIGVGSSQADLGGAHETGYPQASVSGARLSSA